MTHSFSIASSVNPHTARPFGEKYSGEFVIRRPSLKDRREIALREAAGLQIYGPVDIMKLSPEVLNASHIFAHIDQIGEKRPGWCHPEKLWADDPEDEAALYEVWKQVDSFLEKCRGRQSAPPARDEEEKP